MKDEYRLPSQRDFEDFLTDFKKQYPLTKSNKASWISLFCDRFCNRYYKLSAVRPDGSKRRSRSVLVDDLEGLYQAFDFYCQACYVAGCVPNLKSFAVFVGIHTDTFQSWRRNITKNVEYSVFIKSCLDVEESCLLSKCIDENSVGCIFQLRAHFGYNDKPNKLVINVRK